MLFYREAHFTRTCSSEFIIPEVLQSPIPCSAGTEPVIQDAAGTDKLFKQLLHSLAANKKRSGSQTRVLQNHG